MIKKMREMAPTIMIVIIVAFVGGTLFLDWGMNVMGTGHKTPAGKINGRKVSLDAFDRMVNAERFRMQEQGRDIPPQQYRQVPRQVWNQEVSRQLLADAVKSMRLESTVAEVFEYLRRNPIPGLDTASVFMTDGRFDSTKYTQWLTTPQTYSMYPWMVEIEYQVRDQILPGQKLEALLKAGVFVSPAEAAYEYAQRNDKATFDYFKTETRAFKNDTIQVSDNMISNYYAANRELFKQDEQADLYFLKFEKKATENDIAMNRQALIDIKKGIESGEMTFEAAAEVESDDEGSSQKGGDLGWFGRGTMVREFEETAFSIDTGIISNPVKTAFGHHIIKVEEREYDPETGELKRVKARHILLKDNPSNETLDAISDKAEEIRRKLAGKNFAEVASEIAANDPAITFDSTGLFTRGDLPPKVGYLYGASLFAFGRRTNETLSDPLDNQDGVFILGLKKKTKKGVQPLELVRAQIESALRDTLAAKEAMALAQTVREKVVGGATVDAIKEEFTNVVAGVAEDQAVLAYQPQLGFASKAISVAHAIPEGAVSNVIDDRNGFAVVRTLKAVTPQTVDANSPQVKQIADMNAMQARQMAYNEWFRLLRDNAKVEDNIDKFYLD